MESKNLQKASIDEIMNIDVNKDIENYINDFYFSEDDLNKINIPDDLEKIVNSPFAESKKEKKSYVFSWIVDLTLVFILILPMIGVYNPKIFSKYEKVYPFFIRAHEFLRPENIKKLIGSNDTLGSLVNASPVVFIEEKDVEKPSSSHEELDLIHSLSNTLIMADRKWESVEVTPKTIKKALDGIKYIENKYDRVYFRTNLERWSEGDFSNAVEVHNKVWSILGGTVGEAYALDEKNISKIIEKFYK